MSGTLGDRRREGRGAGSLSLSKLRILLRSSAAVLAASALSGCVDVPKPWRVDLVNDPHYQDEGVRFRATYYFRVFDVCNTTPTGQSVLPETDSIYRFTMTGKAPAYTNKVYFEAGTLKSWQIDPFGSSVDFDKKSGQFYFKSQRENEQELRRSQTLKELDELVSLKDKTGIKDTDATKTIDGLITQTLGDLRPDSGVGASVPAAPDVAQAKTAEQQANIALSAAYGGAPPAQPGSDALDKLNDVATSTAATVQKTVDNAKQRAGEAQKIAEAGQKTAIDLQTQAKAAADAADTDVKNLTALQGDQQKQIDDLSTALATLQKSNAGAKTKREAAAKKDEDDLAGRVKTASEAKAALDKKVAEATTARDGLKGGSDAAALATAQKTLDDLTTQQIAAGQKLADVNDQAAASKLKYAQDNAASDAAEAQAESDQNVKIERAKSAKAELDAEVTAAKAVQTATQAASTAADKKVVDAKAIVKTVSDAVAKVTEAAKKFGSPVKTGAANTDTKGEAGAGGCPPNAALRRGFQVLGPEGVRTFNQDDRLILAMSSSADPLISTMQEISSRVLDRRASAADQALPFAKERLSISTTERALDAAGNAIAADKKDPAAALDKILTTFTPTEQKK